MVKFTKISINVKKLSSLGGGGGGGGGGGWQWVALQKKTFYSSLNHVFKKGSDIFRKRI